MRYVTQTKQKPKKQAGLVLLPVILMLILFAGFLIFCRLSSSTFHRAGLSDEVRAIVEDSSHPYAERVAALASEVPQAKKVLERLEEYPDEYLDLLLRNPETAGFVADYPSHKNGSSGKPDISREARKGSVPHFLQWDKRWGYDSYGGSCIAISGCGPTCLSMVYTALTGSDGYDPKSMADYSEENGYYISGSGTSWELMTNGAEGLGLNARECPLDEAVMKSRLEDGELLIVSLGPGDFTTEGHFIVISGTDRKGNFQIKDPNSKIRTEESWSFETLRPQILNLWSFSA